MSSILSMIAADPNVAPAFAEAVKPLDIPAERAEYERRLRKHDWAYEFADDGALWRRGRDEMAALREMQRRLDPDFVLWNEIAPASCRDGASYF